MMINYSNYSSILFDKWNRTPIHHYYDRYHLKNNSEITCRMLQMAVYAFSSMKMAQMIPIKGKYIWLYGAAVALPYAFYLKRMEEGDAKARNLHKIALAIMLVNTVVLTQFRSVAGFASLFTFLALPICLHKRYRDHLGFYAFDFCDDQKNTLLHLAVKSDQQDIAEEIVTIIQKQYQQYPDIYLTYLSRFNKEGYNALHLAKTPEMVKLLVAHQADLNQEANNDKGYTPLMLAAQNNSADLFEALIEAGADLNKSNKKKETALDIAMQNHHWDLAKKILEKKDLLKQETIDQALSNALSNVDKEQQLNFLQGTLDLKTTVEHLRKAIANCDLDIFYLLMKQYQYKDQLKNPMETHENLPELGDLIESISYKNLYFLLNTSPFDLSVRSSAPSYLFRIVKENLQGSDEEIDNMYQYTNMANGIWCCKVEFKGEVLGEGKHEGKKMAKTHAAARALKAMRNHEKYFKHFLLKMPSPDSEDPQLAFVSFLQSVSDSHGDFKVGYWKKEENWTGLLLYKDIPIGLGVDEGEKPSKVGAMQNGLRKFFLLLNKKIEAITIQDIRNLPPIKMAKDSWDVTGD